MRTLVVLAAAALAACSQQPAIEDNSAVAEALPTLDRNEASPSGGPPSNSVASASAPARSPSPIPESLQGRWGLTPVDCTTDRGDAKGLLVVDSKALKFYESRALPSDNVQTSLDSVSGEFNFQGEGQTWTRYVALELRDGKLVRTERDPLATFIYVRC